MGASCGCEDGSGREPELIDGQKPVTKEENSNSGNNLSARQLDVDSQDKAATKI